MGQTLSHGVYLPNEGERNCYAGLASNWQILNTAVGNIAEKAPLVHTHGNITNDGKVGTTANVPLITGTGGVVQAGSFGTSANTFCEGNDSRLSDARTPVAHTHTKSDVTDLFNSANTWTGNNSYTEIVSLASSSDVAEQFKQKLPKDVSVSSDALVRFNTLVDSEDHNVIIEALGHWASYVSKSTTLRYKNDSTKQGTIDFRLESSGAGLFYPQTPFECNLGNSGNQWKSVYAQSYYYNGTQWGLDQNNTWTGNNTISAPSVPSLFFKNTDLIRGSLPQSNLGILIGFTDKNNDTVGGYNYIKGPDGTTRLFLELSTTNTNSQKITRSIRLDTNQEGDSWTFYPSSNGEINLGTSNNKWKSFNGINPGALSLPDMSSGTGVSLSAGSNSYSPPSSGWLSINLTGAISVVCGNFCHSGTDMLSVPVVKGSTYTVTVATSGTAYLFVSQGNV